MGYVAEPGLLWNLDKVIAVEMKSYGNPQTTLWKYAHLPSKASMHARYANMVMQMTKPRNVCGFSC